MRSASSGSDLVFSRLALNQVPRQDFEVVRGPMVTASRMMYGAAKRDLYRSGGPPPRSHVPGGRAMCSASSGSDIVFSRLALNQVSRQVFEPLKVRWF